VGSSERPAQTPEQLLLSFGDLRLNRGSSNAGTLVRHAAISPGQVYTFSAGLSEVDAPVAGEFWVCVGQTCSAPAAQGRVEVPVPVQPSFVVSYGFRPTVAATQAIEVPLTLRLTEGSGQQSWTQEVVVRRDASSVGIGTFTVGEVIFGPGEATSKSLPVAFAPAAGSVGSWTLEVIPDARLEGAPAVGVSLPGVPLAADQPRSTTLSAGHQGSVSGVVAASERALRYAGIDRAFTVRVQSMADPEVVETRTLRIQRPETDATAPTIVLSGKEVPAGTTGLVRLPFEVVSADPYVLSVEHVGEDGQAAVPVVLTSYKYGGGGRSGSWPLPYTFGADTNQGEVAPRLPGAGSLLEDNTWRFRATVTSQYNPAIFSVETFEVSRPASTYAGNVVIPDIEFGKGVKGDSPYALQSTGLTGPLVVGVRKISQTHNYTLYACAGADATSGNCMPTTLTGAEAVYSAHASQTFVGVRARMETTGISVYQPFEALVEVTMGFPNEAPLLRQTVRISRPAAVLAQPEVEAPTSITINGTPSAGVVANYTMRYQDRVYVRLVKRSGPDIQGFIADPADTVPTSPSWSNLSGWAGSMYAGALRTQTGSLRFTVNAGAPAEFTGKYALEFMPSSDTKPGGYDESLKRVVEFDLHRRLADPVVSSWPTTFALSPTRNEYVYTPEIVVQGDPGLSITVEKVSGVGTGSVSAGLCRSGCNDTLSFTSTTAETRFGLHFRSSTTTGEPVSALYRMTVMYSGGFKRSTYDIQVGRP